MDQLTKCHCRHKHTKCATFAACAFNLPRADIRGNGSIALRVCTGKVWLFKSREEAESHRQRRCYENCNSADHALVQIKLPKQKRRGKRASYENWFDRPGFEHIRLPYRD